MLTVMPPLGALFLLFCLWPSLALAGDGAELFASNCAVCHDKGQAGAPDLKNGSWIWGGSVAAVRQTIAHGVRWTQDPMSRKGVMPAFGTDGILEEKEIRAVAEFVSSLHGRSGNRKITEQGAAIYSDQCAQCHGPRGEGNNAFGAPALNRPLRLRSDDEAGIVAQVTAPIYGVMPAFAGQLDESAIDALARYVASRNRAK